MSEVSFGIHVSIPLKDPLMAARIFPLSALALKSCFFSGDTTSLQPCLLLIAPTFPFFVSFIFFLFSLYFSFKWLLSYWLQKYLHGLSSKGWCDTRRFFLRGGSLTNTYVYRPTVKLFQFSWPLSCLCRYFPDPSLSQFNGKGDISGLEAFSHLIWGELFTPLLDKSEDVTGMLVFIRALTSQ